MMETRQSCELTIDEVIDIVRNYKEAEKIILGLRDIFHEFAYNMECGEVQEVEIQSCRFGDDSVKLEMTKDDFNRLIERYENIQNREKERLAEYKKLNE